MEKDWFRGVGNFIVAESQGPGSIIYEGRNGHHWMIGRRTNMLGGGVGGSRGGRSARVRRILPRRRVGSIGCDFCEGFPGGHEIRGPD